MKILELNDTIQAVLEDLSISDPRAALIDTCMTEALCRLSDFRQEAEHFRKKYGVGFEETKKRYEAAPEDFAQYDDLMAWQFAEEGLLHWEKRLEELRHVL